VSRSVCDFSPEQQKNIAAIVWLYRGQQGRFLKLVENYLTQAVELGEAAQEPLDGFEEALGKLTDLITPFANIKRKDDPLAEPWDELTSAQATVTADIEAFGSEAAARAKDWADAGRDNAGLNVARVSLHPLADRCRDLTKQIDLVAKLAGRAIDISVKELDARDSDAWANADISRARKALEAARVEAVEALRRARYFVRQADWLQERFPDAALRDVEGLVKLVDRAAIEAYDWSLTPGRYVGVAPEEQDEDFDFEEALRAIHIDLTGLNEEAAELAARIARNFEELGA
jgi:type I restriction enzyme M protein